MDTEDSVSVPVWLSETTRFESEVWSAVVEEWSTVWALNWCISCLSLDCEGGWDSVGGEGTGGDARV